MVKLTTQDRTDIAIYLYDEGYFCTCNEFDKYWEGKKGRYMLELRHTSDCSGRIKIMELLRDEMERNV